MNRIEKLQRDNAMLYKAYHQAIYDLREMARELSEHLMTNYACSNCTHSEECRQYYINCEYIPAWMKEVEPYYKAADMISCMKSEDVKPVVRGKWRTGTGVLRYTCSVCSTACMGSTKFCPECGADMRGE